MITALSKMGNVIGPNCPHECLQAISLCFRNVLQSNIWHLAANAMTSLEKYASTLLVNHQGTLPHCLPEQSQPFLQSRLTNKVYDLDKKHVIKNHMAQSAQLCVKEGKKLKRMYYVYNNENSSKWQLVPGSRVYKIKRKGQCSAVIILSPDDELCDDEINGLVRVMGDEAVANDKMEVYSVSQEMEGRRGVLLMDRLR
mmetsp:Transcript_55227/g.66481  ORF Transcript_55227/g.66481 Transcript_55227/m.66481 type:complete len:198 (+) Transcript_55227:2-595(+)